MKICDLTFHRTTCLSELFVVAGYCRLLPLFTRLFTGITCKISMALQLMILTRCLAIRFKLACAIIEYLDKSAHLRSLISVFDGQSMRTCSNVLNDSSDLSKRSFLQTKHLCVLIHI